MNRIGKSVLAALLACGFAACTTSDSKNDNTGGKDAAAVASDAATPIATGSDGVLCPAPNALITDFTYPPTATDPTSFHFGDGTTLGGGVYSYPAAIASDFSQSNWHIAGTVADYSGFGLYWDNCSRVDASKYKGITFKVSGTIPAGGALNFTVGTVENAIAASWLIDHGVTSTKATDPGRCMPPADPSLNQYSQSTCHVFEKVIPVTAAATTISILWNEFALGAPSTTVVPASILNLSWYFTWSSGAGYPVDIVIDDLGFIP